MSTIVKHQSTGQFFLLLGCGRTDPKATMPHRIDGSVSPDVGIGKNGFLCVSDHDGRVLWFASSEVTVVSVDDRPISDIINDASNVSETSVELLSDGMETEVEVEEVIRFIDN